MVGGWWLKFWCKQKKFWYIYSKGFYQPTLLGPVGLNVSFYLLFSCLWNSNYCSSLLVILYPFTVIAFSGVDYLLLAKNIIIQVVRAVVWALLLRSWIKTKESFYSHFPHKILQLAFLGTHLLGVLRVWILTSGGLFLQIHCISPLPSVFCLFVCFFTN